MTERARLADDAKHWYRYLEGERLPDSLASAQMAKCFDRLAQFLADEEQAFQRFFERESEE